MTKLDRAFNPKCVAVIGDSGYFQWLRAHSNFKGKLYSVQVNPKTIERIRKLGVENYTSLLDIPDPVDLAIVTVSRKVAPRVLEDCIRKDVAAAHFFTAGFAETDTEEGIALGRLLTQRAIEAKLHLIGPNCMGLFNPRIGIKQTENQYDGVSGPVGFISQSGNHAIDFSLDAHLQGIDVSKSVSFGNGVVLDSAEYLEYLGQDEDTKVIGMYLEGVRDGRRFIEVLKEVAARKPVVVWKGGRTEGGERAIASHTGSLAVPQAIWNATMKQCGALTVGGMEELIDTLKALLYLEPVRGNRVALAGGSGGQSVAVADAFMEAGLEVPPLTQKSYYEFATFFSLIGGGYRNPIDTGNPNRAQMKHILEIIEKDDNIDNIVLLMWVGGAFPDSQNQRDNEINAVIELRKRTSKPVMATLTVPFLPNIVGEARQVIKKFQAGRVPAFASLARGAVALKNAFDYYTLKNGASA